MQPIPSTPLSRVCLIDDDRVLTALLSKFLNNEGFDVICLNGGQAAINHLLTQKHTVDVIVLDIMMPDISGLEVLRTLRGDITTPIIMLTGRGDDIDRILGLEMGADDYLGKPCNPRELSARIKAVLRRTHILSHPSTPENSVAHTVTISNNEGQIIAHNIILEPGKLEARVGTHTLNLTAAEFHVLFILLASAGTITTKETLTMDALGRKLTPYDRSIDVHVSRVRKKLNEISGLGKTIKSIRGRGYQMISNIYETK